jgi:hypothetical protein
MPKYKMICNVPKLSENGLEFKEGEAVTNNKGEVIIQVLTEEEAAIMNKWGVGGIKLVPVNQENAKVGSLLSPSALLKLSKPQLIEYGKGLGLDLSVDMTANIMRDKIKEVQLPKDEPKTE